MEKYPWLPGNAKDTWAKRKTSLPLRSFIPSSCRLEMCQTAAFTILKTLDFHWQCRATDNSEASRTERSAFLEQEGWLAANSRRGTPNELEYQIKITAENLPLAVAFMRSSEQERRVFLPLDLADDTIQPTPGGLPEIRLFSPEIIVWTNSEDDPPPDNVELKTGEGTTTWGKGFILWQAGDWVEITTSGSFYTLGVQVYGDKTIG